MYKESFKLGLFVFSARMIVQCFSKGNSITKVTFKTMTTYLFLILQTEMSNHVRVS